MDKTFHFSLLARVRLGSIMITEIEANKDISLTSEMQHISVFSALHNPQSPRIKEAVEQQQKIKAKRAMGNLHLSARSA